MEPGFGSSAGFMRAVRPILPLLRAHARRFTGNVPDSDDLVQDTLIRAWKARERFEPGTNLKAWMIRIERNSFLNGRRRASRQVDLDPESIDRYLIEGPTQGEQLHFADLSRAVDALPEAQRQAFAGVTAGRRYADIASELGISEGTLKSRVSRARVAIVRALEAGKPVDILPGAATDEVAGTTEPAASPIYEAWKRSGSRMIG